MHYLAFIEHDGAAWGGFIPELNTSATGKDRQQVLHRLAQGATFTLLALVEEGIPRPEARLKTADDLGLEERLEVQGMEAVFVTPARISSTSVAIERAIRRSGLTRSEVACRMGTSPAAITRITDMFYFDHSLPTLRQLSQALSLPLSRFSGLKDLAAEEFLSSHDGMTDLPGEVTLRWSPELERLELPALVRWEGLLFWLDARPKPAFDVGGLRLLSFEGSMVDDHGYVRSILNSA